MKKENNSIIYLAIFAALLLFNLNLTGNVIESTSLETTKLDLPSTEGLDGVTPKPTQSLSFPEQPTSSDKLPSSITEQFESKLTKACKISPLTQSVSIRNSASASVTKQKLGKVQKGGNCGQLLGLNGNRGFCNNYLYPKCLSQASAGLNSNDCAAACIKQSCRYKQNSFSRTGDSKGSCYTSFSKTADPEDSNLEICYISGTQSCIVYGRCKCEP